MYVITRTDLRPGVQAAQSAHALAKWTIENPEAARAWHDNSQFLILLGAPNEKTLSAYAEIFPDTTIYREPDYNDEITSICLGLGADKYVSDLPLLLREPTMV